MPENENRSVLTFIFPLVLLGITIFAVGLSYFIWIDVKNDRYNDLANSASIIHKFYELTFYQRQTSLKTVGDRLLNITGESADSLRLAYAKEALVDHVDLLAFGLADTTGQLTTFTGAQLHDKLPNLMESTASKRSFLEAKRSKGLVIGEAYYFEPIQDWIIPIRVSIRNRVGELVAINTSAVSYVNMIRNLKSFGFEKNYNIQFVNSTYNTSQLYYPLDDINFTNILGKNASIYTQISILKEPDNLRYFKAFNKFENKKILGVSTSKNDLNHYVVVSVDQAIIWDVFSKNLYTIIATYLMLVVILKLVFEFLKKKEVAYNLELTTERDYSQNIINGTPALIIGINNKGISTFINPAVEKVTAYSKEELIGKNWWKIMYPPEEFHQVEQLFKVFEKGNVRNYQMTLTTKDGEKRVVSWNSINNLNQNNELIEVIGFGSDITELISARKELETYASNLEILVRERTLELEKTNYKLTEGNSALESKHRALQAALENLTKTQNQLVQVEKMASLGVLSAGIGHEINNPLNFIMGGVHGINTILNSKTDNLKDEIIPLTAIITEGARRAKDIVTSLSHFSRKEHVTKEVCEMHDIVDNCLIMLQNKTKHKINILKEYSTDTISVLGNDGKLHRAILNILLNAVQAIEKKGTITISTFLNDKIITLKINDDGIGIPEENIAKIHDPFYTTRPPGEGTGLGLSITYTIIEEHGGKIFVHSKENKGTEVTITLPANYD